MLIFNARLLVLLAAVAGCSAVLVPVPRGGKNATHRKPLSEAERAAKRDEDRLARRKHYEQVKRHRQWLRAHKKKQARQARAEEHAAGGVEDPYWGAEPTLPPEEQPAAAPESVPVVEAEGSPSEDGTPAEAAAGAQEPSAAAPVAISEEGAEDSLTQNSTSAETVAASLPAITEDGADRDLSVGNETAPLDGSVALHGNERAISGSRFQLTPALLGGTHLSDCACGWTAEEGKCDLGQDDGGECWFVCCIGGKTSDCKCKWAADKPEACHPKRNDGSQCWKDCCAGVHYMHRKQ